MKTGTWRNNRALHSSLRPISLGCLIWHTSQTLTLACAHMYTHMHVHAHTWAYMCTYAHCKAYKSNAGLLEYKCNFAEIFSISGRGQVYIMWLSTNHMSMSFSHWGPTLSDASFCSSLPLEPFPYCAFHWDSPTLSCVEQSSIFSWPFLCTDSSASPRKKTKKAAQILFRRWEEGTLSIFMLVCLALWLSWQIRTLFQNTSNYVNLWNVFCNVREENSVVYNHQIKNTHTNVFVWLPDCFTLK